MKLQFSKVSRKASINLPMDELICMGWKKGDEIQIVDTDPLKSTMTLKNTKRYIEPVIYKQTKNIMKDGLHKFNSKTLWEYKSNIRASIVKDVNGKHYMTGLDNRKVLEDSGFSGNFNKSGDILKFLRKRKDIAKNIGVVWKIDLLEKYNSRILKGLIDINMTIE